MTGRKKALAVLLGLSILLGAASTAAAQTYPLQTSKTLTYWVMLNGNLGAVANNVSDTPFGKELEKQTGVKVVYTEGSSDPDAATQQLNLLLASGQLPDIIEYNWLTFPGGPEKVIQDGYIIKLNDAIDKYAPNYKKFLADNPAVAKMVKTDSGTQYCFPYIANDDLLLTTSGPIVRKDWLDKLHLAVPQTMDDWHAVLAAFRDKMGAASPLTYEGWMFDEESVFAGAYGIGGIITSDSGSGNSFYVNNGKVMYGPMQPAYKDFLATYSQWYREGLLDKNLASVDKKTVALQITTGQSGASLGYAGSRIGTWLPAGRQRDPGFDLVGAPYPVLRKGDRPRFAQASTYYSGEGGAAITTQSKNVELAARFLDFAYSDKGHMLFNFGIVGQSYNLVGGQPVYTDLILNNPNKLPPAQALALYSHAYTGGPFVGDKRYLLQYYALDEQKAALSTWSNTDAQKYLLPPVSPTPAESNKVTSIITQVTTYQSEMFWKFVMGVEPLSNFDKYVDQLKHLGVEDAIAVYQSALNRYNSR